jgi:hypothetical protein
VVGDDEPVQGPGELHPLSVGGGHLLAPGEAVGLLGAENDAEGPGVKGVVGVEVGVAPEDLRRVVAPGVGGVARRLEDIPDVLLGYDAGVVRQGG